MGKGERQGEAWREGERGRGVNITRTRKTGSGKGGRDKQGETESRKTNLPMFMSEEVVLD